MITRTHSIVPLCHFYPSLQDQLNPPDGSPSTLPSFIKDLRLIDFKLGNAPPKVGTIRVPEGQQDGKLPDGDLVLETPYSFDSDDMNVAVVASVLEVLLVYVHF